MRRAPHAGQKPSSALRDPGDFRSHFPRFSPQHAAQNAALVDAFRAFAQARGLTPGQLALAWVLLRQPGFVPVVGARTRAQLSDALATLSRPLSVEDAEALEELIPAERVAGNRYAAPQMASLDSER